MAVKTAVWRVIISERIGELDSTLTNVRTAVCKVVHCRRLYRKDVCTDIRMDVRADVSTIFLPDVFTSVCADDREVVHYRRSHGNDDEIGTQRSNIQCNW